MKTHNTKATKPLQGGIFFYIFYAGFAIVWIYVLVQLIQYFFFDKVDTKLAIKTGTVMISYLFFYWKVYKRKKEIIDILFGIKSDGLRNELTDKKIRREVKKAINIAVEFGKDKAIRRLKKAEQKAGSYDDKAVICFIMGLMEEVGQEKQEAMKYYNKALAYRPYYELPLAKINCIL